MAWTAQWRRKIAPKYKFENNLLLRVFSWAVSDKIQASSKEKYYVISVENDQML